MSELKLNEALAMMDLMAERLRFSNRHLGRFIEDAEGQLDLNVELVEEYERLTEKWSDEE